MLAGKAAARRPLPRQETPAGTGEMSAEGCGIRFRVQGFGFWVERRSEVKSSSEVLDLCWRAHALVGARAE
jgi:hypothetical protein